MTRVFFSAATVNLVWAATLALAPACDARDAATDDDADLAQTIVSLRNAPNHAKRPWLERLEKSKCTTPTACRLRDVCAKAYRFHDRALESARAARHTIHTDAGANPRAQGDAGTNALEQSARLVLEAEAALDRAREAAHDCASLEVQWRLP